MEFLVERCEPVLLTRQPGGSQRSHEIRQLILAHQSGEQLTSLCELFLYMADRAQHVDTVIRPALEVGKIVLCDRYSDSTLAYQGYGRQMNLNLIVSLNQAATQGLMPDLTFWLDLDPLEGLQRIAMRLPLDRLEGESLAFHQRIHQGYQELAAAEPERFVRVDSKAPPDGVFAQIRERLEKLL